MSDVLSQQRFDGIKVDLYAGRYSGAFDVEVADAESQRLDQEVFFVVRARLKGANMTETKAGDLLRTNVYEVSDVNVIDPTLGFKLQTATAAQLSLSIGSDLLDGVDDPDAEDDDH